MSVFTEIKKVFYNPASGVIYKENHLNITQGVLIVKKMKGVSDKEFKELISSMEIRFKLPKKNKK